MPVRFRTLVQRLAVVTMPRVAAMLETVLLVCVFVRLVHRSPFRFCAHEADTGPCHRWKVKSLAWKRWTRGKPDPARTGAFGTAHWS